MRTLLRQTAGATLIAAIAAASVFTADSAWAAKKYYDVYSNRTHGTAAVADKKTDTLHWISGNYTPSRKGNFQMRVIADTPRHKPKALTDWKKAAYVGEISHVHRTTFNFKKHPKHFPNKTKLYIQVKGHGRTPAITL